MPHPGPIRRAYDLRNPGADSSDETIPTSRSVPIHDAEYYIYLEKPEELARVIFEIRYRSTVTGF